MPSSSQAIADESELQLQVHLLISRYLFALDAEDADLLGRCFTPDVEAIYHVDTPQERRQTGHEAVVGALTGRSQTYSVRTHALANHHAHAVEGGARCVSHVVANVVANQRVMVRGIRYTDLVRHDDQGWRIYWREHKPLWQYDALRTRLQTPTVPLPPDAEDYSGPGRPGPAAAN